MALPNVESTTIDRVLLDFSAMVNVGRCRDLEEFMPRSRRDRPVSAAVRLFRLGVEEAWMNVDFDVIGGEEPPVDP